MGKVTRAAKKAIRRIASIDEYYRAKMHYPALLEKAQTDSSLVLLESQHGSCFDGNIFYLLKELTSGRYEGYAFCLSVRASKCEQAKEFLEFHGIAGVEIVVLSSDRYFEVLANAKYLINDNTFLPFFVKREDQVYLNTWHGTPLKTLGRYSREAINTIGNTQRNFCQADYILAPNEHTYNCLLKGYMLENLSNAAFLMADYPRNEAFFDAESAYLIRKDMGTESLQAIAYMPTWRQYGSFADKQAEAYLIYHLTELDRQLADGQRMYVNLHPVSRRSVDFSSFDHLEAFPSQYETYEFLNSCDCLVTDYSSVLFDYLLTRKKIVLFVYDEEKYESERGFMFPLKELGLPVARSAEQLVSELGCPVDKEIHEQLVKRFAPFKSPNTSQRLCDLLFGKSSQDAIEAILVGRNNKKNVLVYAGNLARNGITSSFRSLLEATDAFDDCNVFLTLRQKFPAGNKKTLIDISDSAPFILMPGKMNLSFFEKGVQYLHQQRLFPSRLYMRLMKPAYRRERERLFGSMGFDHVIHFSGYEYKVMMLVDSFDCDKTIFVHNNMVEEMRVKRNQRKAILRYAYRSFDYVALVSKDMEEPTRAISGRSENFVLVQNAFDYQRVVCAAKEPISFDCDTLCNVSKEELEHVVSSLEAKLISVGRFAPEKQHRRLIDSFCKALEVHPDSYLIIIGGNSYSSKEHSYSALCDYVRTLDCANRIILIQSMSNPYSVVGRCDGFILPSSHEGLGLVLLEADALGIPVVATDIPGPCGFMREHGGTLVPDTAEGVYAGVLALMEKRVGCLSIDYEQRNREIAHVFRTLIA